MRETNSGRSLATSLLPESVKSCLKESDGRQLFQRDSLRRQALHTSVLFGKKLAWRYCFWGEGCLPPPVHESQKAKTRLGLYSPYLQFTKAGGNLLPWTICPSWVPRVFFGGKTRVESAAGQDDLGIMASTQEAKTSPRPRRARVGRGTRGWPRWAGFE